jgi:hypothetical protein
LLDKYNSLITRLVKSGDRVVRFQPQPGAHGTYNIALIITSSGASELLVGPGSSPPASSVFQVWLMHNRKNFRSAGVFGPTPNTLGTQPIFGTWFAYNQAEVTVEPGPRGSLNPTSKPILFLSFGS